MLLSAYTVMQNNHKFYSEKVGNSEYLISVQGQVLIRNEFDGLIGKGSTGQIATAQKMRLPPKLQLVDTVVKKSNEWLTKEECLV